MPTIRDRRVTTPASPGSTSTTPTVSTPATPAAPKSWGNGGPPAASDGFQPSTSLRSAPSLAAVAAGTASLEKGAKGEGVKTMQEALIKAGYPLPRFGADADFGTETLTALKKFQLDAGVPQSGKFDKATLDKLAGPQAQPPKPATPAEPSNYLLKDPSLASVAQGEVTLSEGAKGDGVVKLQEALQLAGYKLPKYGADGDFGGETIAALKQVQTKAGLTPSGRLDAPTLQALDVAATKGLKFPPFDKLFADGKLNSTIAVGYDEAGWHRAETREIVKGLLGDGTPANPGQGYTELNPRTASAEQLQKAGLDPATVDKDVRYFVKTFQHEGKDVQSIVKLITPETPNAKEKFAHEMETSEMVMYSGHGRYGSGPDFDDINSTAGNFRIGDPYEAGHVQLGENDLAKAKMTKDYQLMMFAGCTTFKYLDDLRAKPGKDSKNLDLMVSTDLLYWGNLGPSNLEMLDSVSSGRSLNEMKSRVETVNAQPGKKSVWKADGIQDN